MPRLSQFIRDHTEQILAEWETFARTLPAAESMDIAALRDHAKEMLCVITADLDTPQTPGEQSDKSEGKSDATETGAPSTAAQEHGAARASSGFTIAQMLSELRALRASVIRLWTAENASLAPTDLEDLIRFNEAIDQTLAESITQYGDDISQSKERFLAILGHDLRNPLGAILMSAAFVLETGDLKEPQATLVKRIEGSARRMNGMVTDLLDFTQARFGTGIPIVRAAMDGRQMVEDVVAEVTARYPATSITIDAQGDLRGEWDSARLTQAFTNLLTNAVQHGVAGSPISVVAAGTGEEVVFSVRNDGTPISEADLAQIFRVGVQGRRGGRVDDHHLGLGLYIVDKIVAAHGGRIDVQSTTEQGTTFSVHLPRTMAD